MSVCCLEYGLCTTSSAQVLPHYVVLSLTSALQAQSPRMKEPHQAEAAAEPQQPQRKLSQKRAAVERPDRNAKKGRLEPLDTEDIPQEAASPADEQALSTGAVKPETPAKVTGLTLPSCIYIPSMQSVGTPACALAKLRQSLNFTVSVTQSTASGLNQQTLLTAGWCRAA